MKVISREVFAEHEDGRPVVNGFVSYISADSSVLMLCTGYEDYSDAYDDYSTRISRDNGATWTKLESRWIGYDVEGGKIRYAEPAALFDPDTGKLMVLVDENLYPDDTLNVDGVCRVTLDTYDTGTEAWSDRELLDLSPGRALAVSFPFPIKTSAGRIVCPAMRHILDAEGKTIHVRGCWAPAHESLMILGDYRADGSIDWHLGSPVPLDLDRTSRGLDENTVVELSDGRLALVCRGDNSMFPEKQGYKWLSFSGDQGESWSAAEPLRCDRGDPIESSATGSALFRSRVSGKIYWVGNLCIHGVRANGNYPRSPLVVAEVQEDPFAIRRDTITVIDQQAPGEPEKVQMSNFQYYQDRETGELVVFVTRYAEESAEDWKRANYYRYRVEID